MITKENEYIFNIILSLFLGIGCIVLFNGLFDSPRIINIYKTNNLDKNNHNNVYLLSDT